MDSAASPDLYETRDLNHAALLLATEFRIHETKVAGKIVYFYFAGKKECAEQVRKAEWEDLQVSFSKFTNARSRLKKAIFSALPPRSAT